MARAKKGSGIFQLRVAGTLTSDQVEGAIGASGAGGRPTSGAELARVDYLPDETVLYYRGDKSSDHRVRKAVKATEPKAKLRGKRVTAAALGRAILTS